LPQPGYYRWFIAGSLLVQSGAMEKNKQLLAACLLEIERSVGWGPASDWSNEDFENLSDKVFEKTGTRLSLSTMRRIWGRIRYDGFPNSATLNALAAFAGYTDWRSFCTQHATKENITENHDDVPAAPEIYEAIPKKSPARGIKRWAAISLLTGAIVLLAYQYNRNPKINYNANYVFSARKVTDDLPNSVVFTYDARAAAGAKVMIQQSWDTSRREYVDAKGTKHTSIYYYPGYFRAKLMINDKVVRQTPVYIQTKGWKAIAQREPLPVYFNNQDIWQKEKLSVSAKQMVKAFNGSQLNNHWVEFDNMREFPGIDGDNFVFETELRNTATVEECLCRKVRIVLLGANYPMMLPLAAKGCVADINVFLGDSAILGKEHDLSAFGCDFQNPQLLRCEVQKSMIKIFLNNNLILSVPHSKPMGKVLGIRVVFEGAGEITKVRLASAHANYDLMKKE
jgi:hypothetical protein